MEKRRKCVGLRRPHAPRPRTSCVPTLTQGHVALHGLSSHCMLNPPVGTAQHGASERSSTFLSLTTIAHCVLPFCCALPGPEIPGLPGPAGSLPPLLHSGRTQGSNKERREQERLTERDPGPLILHLLPPMILCYTYTFSHFT